MQKEEIAPPGVAIQPLQGLGQIVIGTRQLARDVERNVETLVVAVAVDGSLVGDGLRGPAGGAEPFGQGLEACGQLRPHGARDPHAVARGNYPGEDRRKGRTGPGGVADDGIEAQGRDSGDEGEQKEPVGARARAAKARDSRGAEKENEDNPFIKDRREKKAKKDAEKKAKKEAEEKARQEEAEQKAKEEAEEKARQEAEERARQEAVAKAKAEAEAAEQAAKAEAEAAVQAAKAAAEAADRAAEEAEAKAEAESAGSERDSQMMALAKLVTDKARTDSELEIMTNEQKLLTERCNNLRGMNEELMTMLEQMKGIDA